MPQPPPAADSYQQQGCIRMTLENADLWKSFYSINTEMIIAKHGRRMFPHCCIRLSGLQPFANYVIMVDMVPVDNFKYKWKKEQWEVAGKAEPQPPCRTYVHPDSPAPGRHWMKKAFSFKMKLTNNTLDQHGHIILHSMHRYYPRFHVTQADSPYTVRWAPSQTFSFQETTFTAVTAYQNPKITKLKIDHNPFAKGFREGGTHSHSKRCHPNRSPPAKRTKKSLCNSPPGLQRMPSTSHLEQEQKNEASTQPQSLKRGDLSAWALEQDLSESLPAEPLELHESDYSCEEQMVPASFCVAYQPYRSAEYATFQLPSNDAVAEYARFPLPSSDAAAAHTTVHPPPHPLATAEHNTQQLQNGYYHHPHHHHGHAADWSQYPLFSYSCW